MTFDESSETSRTTADTLLGGAVQFEQPAEGYRAPVDGLLLATFAGQASHGAVDLGAGAGMVALTLLARDSVASIVAVERDATLAACLSRNIERNGFAARATVLCDDVESAARARRGSAELVVANPPFFEADRVTPSAHPRARAARTGNDPLGAFARAARQLLRRGGRACFVWPAFEIEHLLATCASVGLHAKRARLVHPLPDRPASRVLVEFRAGRQGGCGFDPALILCERTGVATPEADRITGRTSR